MTEFAMGPSVAPALHLVALRQLPKDSLFYGAQDERSDGYPIGEENMTCLTNLADSSGCQWGPVGGCQWIRQSAEKSSGRLGARKTHGLEELFCAVAQQSEVGFLNYQKSESSDDSKSDDPENLISVSDEDVRRTGQRQSYDQVESGGVKGCTSLENEDMTDLGTYQLMNYDQKDYGQHFAECNTSHLKPQVEKLGWRNMGRHAENRRKRWAQSDPLLDIWKAVSSSRHAAPFRRPVALLDDYDSIIRQPIDLSTIRRQLESDETYNLESLRRDLMLMVTNALVYNKKGTETYEMAVKLKMHACRLFEGHGKDSLLYGYKVSPPGISSKSTIKVSRAKSVMQCASEPQFGSENLPLAPVKKHRTMRRPRTCISNDTNGLRSDVANGAAIDSSSEEEAAAVLICFSSGQVGDDKLPMSKITKLECPRKRLKRVETETDETSLCSGTQRNAVTHVDENVTSTDVGNLSAHPSPSASMRGVEIRPMLEDPEKYMYRTAMNISEAKNFEKSGASVSDINQGTAGSSAASNPDEIGTGNRRSERTCMGLKHKWQERWRMQSAASSESNGSLPQSSDSVAIKTFGDKYSMEGGSGGETNYRPYPQEHAQVLRPLV